MAETFSIGTAGTRISLINASGFYVKEGWRPRAAEIDDIWQESALADYKQLAAYRDLTVLESIPLALLASSQDNAAALTQSLRQMLRTARNYWATTWEDSLVYLQLQGSSETNARYAIVHAGRLPEDESTFSCWMEETGAARMPDLMLIVERGPWLENAPGTGTAVELSARETYDSRYLGNVTCAGTRDPTTAEGEVFIANKRNEANLTDVYFWDESGGSWNGSNLMDDADCGFAFLPAVPGADDFALFGIDTSLSDSGPFCSLVFDIGTAIDPGTTITIEWRYKGSGDTDDPDTWTQLDVQDNTNADGAMTGAAFDTTGVHSVHWVQPSDWATSNPDPTGANAIGVTGYWVAAYVTVSNDDGTPPAQQNRPIYTVTWPYIEVQSSEIGGDLPALMKMRIRTQADHDGAAGDPDVECNRLLVGLRSTARGSNFAAYLNASDEQNPTGITAGVAGGAIVFATDVQTPTGRKVTAPNIGADELICYWTIGESYYYEYFGRYRVFVRVDQTSGSAGDISLRTQINTYGQGETFSGSWVPTTSTGRMHIVDLGQLTLGPGDLTTADDMQISISVYGDGDGVVDIDIFDLILLPVDEWAGDFEDLRDTDSLCDRSGASNFANGTLDIDSIENPRRQIRGLLHPYADLDEIRAIYRPISNGPAIFRNAETQRLWFLAIDHLDIAPFEAAFSVQNWKVDRFESLRGAG